MCIIQQIAQMCYNLLGIIRCFMQFYRKHLVLKAVCLMGAWKFIKMRINVLQATHFTAATWQQVTQKTTVNCFCLCGYGHELNLEAGSHSSSYYYYYSFHEDWTRLLPEDVNFSSYTSVDNWPCSMWLFQHMTFNQCCLTKAHTVYDIVK
jgi:hypothetical protein